MFFQLGLKWILKWLGYLVSKKRSKRLTISCTSRQRNVTLSLFWTSCCLRCQSLCCHWIGPPLNRRRRFTGFWAFLLKRQVFCRASAWPHFSPQNFCLVGCHDLQPALCPLPSLCYMLPDSFTFTCISSPIKPGTCISLVYLLSSLVRWFSSDHVPALLVVTVIDFVDCTLFAFDSIFCLMSLVPPLDRLSLTCTDLSPGFNGFFCPHQVWVKHFGPNHLGRVLTFSP